MEKHQIYAPSLVHSYPFYIFQNVWTPPKNPEFRFETLFAVVRNIFWKLNLKQNNLGLKIWNGCLNLWCYSKHVHCNPVCLSVWLQTMHSYIFNETICSSSFCTHCNFRIDCVSNDPSGSGNLCQLFWVSAALNTNALWHTQELLTAAAAAVNCGMGGKYWSDPRPHRWVLAQTELHKWDFKMVSCLKH